MRYSLDLVWLFDQKTIDIEAESPQDAMQKAKGQFPNHRCDFIGSANGEINHEIMVCESCQKDILDIDVASTDDEETQYYCKECHEALWVNNEEK